MTDALPPRTSSHPGEPDGLRRPVFDTDCSVNPGQRSLAVARVPIGQTRAAPMSRTAQAKRMRMSFKLGVLLVAVTTACSGCSWIHRISAPKPSSRVAKGQQPGSPTLPSAVQSQSMRFADGYASRIAEATEDFRRLEPTPEARRAAVKWKLSQATAAYIDASDASPVVGGLDLVTLATLSRAVVEDYFVGQAFGESARPLLETHRQLEAEAWAIARSMLKPEQEQQLRDLIAGWRAAHPDQVQVYQVRLRDFAAYGGGGAAEQASRPTGILGVLGLDPLAGLDPTVRAIEGTRLLAERTSYYLQRLPTLLNWHAEVLAYELASTPESQQVLSDAERMTKAAEVFANTAEQLPQLVNDQREAAIDQVFERFAANNERLRASLVQLRETMQSGTELAKSTDAAVQSLDRFVARFDKGAKAAGTATKSRPFDILDYATTAKELAGTIEELNVTLNSLDQAMPKIAAVAGTLESAGNRLLVRLLLVGTALIVLLVGGALSAALLYRRLGRPSNRVA